MTDVIKGTALYLRSMHGPGTPTDKVEKGAIAMLARAKHMGLSWIAIGGPWQDSATQQKFLNTPEECQIYAKVFEDAGLPAFVWGYPWLGGEQKFVDSMLDCAGDYGLHLLDPELGMNPSRKDDSKHMDVSNASASVIVHGLRAGGAKIVGLSTYGGVPSWFPLRAFLQAGVDFAGGQTYTDDGTIDKSISNFIEEERKFSTHDAQLVPNYGLYAKDGDGYRSKTPQELRVHLNEFINEGEPVRAMIGWAENFITPQLEVVLAEFSARLRAM